MNDPVTVVAGNGASLMALAPGRVLAEDRIIRTNNFFFEPEFYLGTRVDLAFIGGDPRVAPFVFETLNRARQQYDVRAWSAPSERVARIGKRFLDLPFAPRHHGGPEVVAALEALQARYQAKPSTGVQALLMAYGMGARRILLAGIDLYTGGQRYAYAPGRHQRDLLGADVGTRSYDLRLHHPDLDRAMLAWLAERDELEIWRGGDVAALNDVLDLAPARDGALPKSEPKPQILDWADWAGWYPIALLKLLRRLRRWQRQITRSAP